MAKNLLVADRTADEIDKRVARVLERLGNPEPPLDLAAVRELLEIDLSYFQASDPTLLEETLVRLKIGKKRTIQSAIALSEAVKKWSLRALFIPDQNRILLERSLPPPKLRWNESHEIGHSLIPWHLNSMLGDNATTLSPTCHARIEAEANYAAGRLLFLRNRFDIEVHDSQISLQVIRGLASAFANSITTTMWRFIEVRGKHLPIVGMLSAHPNPVRRNPEFDPTKPCRYLIQSRLFSERFGNTSELDLFRLISGYAKHASRGPLGADEIVLKDDSGERHLFAFETFWNGHEALTLGTYLRPVPELIAVNLSR
ncbi:MAG: ImmA/IrrE family metallo-endopeptidase [Rhabdochlamydiaceae bacterium]